MILVLWIAFLPERPVMNLKHLHLEMKSLGDADKAAHAQGFFKTGPGQYGEGDVFLGIRVPVVRKVASKYRDLPLNLTTILLESVYHEERLLALFILVKQFAQGNDAEQEAIFNLYMDHTGFINNWDLVDSSAHLIVGARLQNGPRTMLVQMTHSKILWERRMAMMATLHFIRQNDFKDALLVAERLLHDEHDLIHKIVGWMLREIGNRDRAVEENFLRKHYQEMPRTMLRYAIEKFPEDLRQQYLKGTIL